MLVLFPESLATSVCILSTASPPAGTLTSTIKPIWILTGGLTEVYFSIPGHDNFSPAYNGPWDPENKTVDIWGTGDETWDLTTEKDAAEFSAEVIQRDDARYTG
ncbi:hypothetical protein CEP53_014944 [Fusarium sp. AF-6]|nr:hypothetical protein CEP53_014944 [Fusarium sp. AF-6]